VRCFSFPPRSRWGSASRCGERWRDYLVISLYNNVLPFLCIAWAAGVLPASYLSVISGTVPLWAGVFAAWMLKEPLPPRQIAGFVLGVAGVALIVNLGPVALDARSLLGVAATLAGTALWGLGGVVIKKRAEVGETVSPFGVAGQSTREGGAIATIADLGELEVQTEVSENGVAKLVPAMPAEVKLQAYQDQVYKGRLRQVFPSADRAKSIVEVRVTILDPDVRVKPEMTATVTFQEPKRADQGQATSPGAGAAAPPVVLVPKRAIAESNNQAYVWVVSGGIASRRQVTRGAERLDQVEVRSGLSAGEAVIMNPPAGLQNSSLVRIKGS